MEEGEYMRLLKLKILSILIVILFLFQTYSFTYTILGATQQVEIKSVTVNPPVVSAYSTFMFKVLVHTDILAMQDTFYIKFPKEFTFPNSISKDAVNFFGQISPYSINILDGNTLSVVSSRDFRLGEGYLNTPILINILDIAYIRNPTNSGIYYFEIWTNKEPVHAQYGIYIGDLIQGNSVSNVTVSLSNYSANKKAEYRIGFTVSDSGALIYDKGDYITVVFPKESTLPTDIKPERVMVNRLNPSKIEVNNNVLKIYLNSSSQFIPASSYCEIVIFEDFGVVNPEFPGDYIIQVSTSKDKGLASSNAFKILGTWISELSVSLMPDNQIANAEYNISFKTSMSNESVLIKNVSKINIKFDPAFILPSFVKPGAILVNDVTCTNAYFRSNMLTIVTPINVDSNSTVNVTIKKDFGIQNPKDVGKYNIFVDTSSDAEFVATTVEVKKSTIINPQVSLSNTSSGQVCQYTVTFKTGYSGNLDPGIDRIIVVFPLGTTIPSLIPNTTILVNGIPTTLVEVTGTTFTITTPVAISALGDVSVVFLDKAGIRNPVNEGQYSLRIYTTKEQTPIETNKFSIESVPQTTLFITPDKPDGENGFYKTMPLIRLEATSSIDPSPKIYYAFDNDNFIPYEKPFNAKEGVHILKYYAVDSKGHEEEAHSVTIKVDTIKPALIVNYPQNGETINEKNITIKGQTEPGCIVLVNGEKASVDDSGVFVFPFTLNNSQTIIEIESIDPASNTTKISLQVNLDLTPPSITITQPKMFENIYRLPLLIAGKVSKPCSLTINGQNVQVMDDYSFKFEITNLEKGSNKIEIVAIDKASNVSKQVIFVNYYQNLQIILKVGSKSVLINGSPQVIDAAPVIINGRTMVPLRFLGETFGAMFNYDSVSKTISIDFNGKKMVLRVGNKIALVDNKEVQLDVGPVIVNGRTLVPLRFISENFGCDVIWDDSAKTVIVTYPKK